MKAEAGSVQFCSTIGVSIICCPETYTCNIYFVYLKEQDKPSILKDVFVRLFMLFIAIILTHHLLV